MMRLMFLGARCSCRLRGESVFSEDRGREMPPPPKGMPPKGKGKPPQVPLSKKAVEAAAHNKAIAQEAAARRAANNQSRKAGKAGMAARAVSKELTAAAAGAGAAAEAAAAAIADAETNTTDPSEVASYQGSAAVEAASDVAEQFSHLASEASDEDSEFLGTSAGMSKKEKNKSRRSAQAEEKKRSVALKQSQLQDLLQSRGGPDPVPTRNYTEKFTDQNLINLNKKVEDSVNWDKEFNKVDAQGLSLRKTIQDWAIQCNYNLEHITSNNGYVVLEFTNDIHFTFHSSNEGIIGKRKEVMRGVKGAFHVQKKSEDKLIRYISKSSDPFYFQKSQVQIRQGVTQFDAKEKRFIDGVFSIINEAKVRGEAKGGRRRTRKLRR